MIISVPVEIGMTRLESFPDLVEAVFGVAMQFGRELMRRTLEEKDEDLYTLPPLPVQEKEAEPDLGSPLSASKVPETVGKGYECCKRANLLNLPFLKAITGFVSFCNLRL